MSEAKAEPRRRVTLAELEPLMRECFAAGTCFKLPVTGTSNLPTLAPDRDEVILDAVNAPLKRGDLPLYRRETGQYVLHRIVGLQSDGSYVCCGDHQRQKETGVRPEQVIGVTVRLVRKGRVLEADSRGYRLWVRFWVWALPCRKPFLLLYHGWKRLVGSLRRKR